MYPLINTKQGNYTTLVTSESLLELALAVSTQRGATNPCLAQLVTVVWLLTAGIS